MFERTKNLFWISKKEQTFVPVSQMWGFEALFGNQYNNKEVRQLNRTDYLTLYTGWVYFCVTKIAQTLSSLETQVVNEKYEVIPNKYNGLINSELLEWITAFLLLNGSSFWKLDKIGRNINDINLLRPDLIDFQQQKGEALTWYKYRLPTGQFMNIALEDMLDIHLFNPLEVYPNKTKGISPVQAVATQMSTDLATMNWDWKFFENGATPSGVFTTQQDVNVESLERFKKDWRNKYGWVKNSHKTAVLPFGMDYKTITPSQSELDFVNKRRFTKEEIFTIFGVPEALFSKDSNLATAKVAENTFMKYTILPLAKKIETAINKKIYKDQGIFQFVNVVPTDTDELNTIFTNGGITLNEYRQQLNYDPVKWGDVVRTMFGELEVSPEEVKKIDEVQQKKVQGFSKSIKQSIRGTEEWKEKKWEEKIFRNNWYEAKYKTAFMRIFEAQEKDIINELRSIKSTKKKPKWNALKYSTMYFSLLSQPQEELYQAEGNEALRLAWLNDFFVVWETIRNGFLRDNLKRIATDIDKTTKTEIFDIIQRGENEGVWVDEIVKNVQTKFVQYKASRIENIVRSETIYAGTQASIQAWEDTEVVEGKEWFTAMDERVCPHCNAMNGKTIWLKDDFFKKGATMETGLKLDYRNVDGSPIHPQCRCTLLPILID